MLGRKQHLVSNLGLDVKVGGGGVRGQRVPSVLQRRHGRNWTHKSLWLSHLDEQCSQCLQGEDRGYEDIQVQAGQRTHMYEHTLRY